MKDEIENVLDFYGCLDKMKRQSECDVIINKILAIVQDHTKLMKGNRVNVPQVLKVLKSLGDVDKKDLKELEFVDDGGLIDTDPKKLQYFDSMGLNNTCFVELFLGETINEQI